MCVSHARTDRKSTRLNSSHVEISYAVFCLKKKTAKPRRPTSAGAARDPSQQLDYPVQGPAKARRATAPALAALLDWMPDLVGHRVRGDERILGERLEVAPRVGHPGAARASTQRHRRRG